METEKFKKSALKNIQKENMEFSPRHKRKLIPSFIRHLFRKRKGNKVKCATVAPTPHIIENEAHSLILSASLSDSMRNHTHFSDNDWILCPHMKEEEKGDTNEIDSQQEAEDLNEEEEDDDEYKGREEKEGDNDSDSSSERIKKIIDWWENRPERRLTGDKKETEEYANYTDRMFIEWNKIHDWEDADSSHALRPSMIEWEETSASSLGSRECDPIQGNKIPEIESSTEGCLPGPSWLNPLYAVPYTKSNISAFQRLERELDAEGHASGSSDETKKCEKDSSLTSCRK